MENFVATYVLTSFCFLILNAETTVPWYEDLPAVAMDYKVHIDPGKEDCYFQYVNPGATFYVSFQVAGLQIAYILSICYVFIGVIVFNIWPKMIF